MKHDLTSHSLEGYAGYMGRIPGITVHIVYLCEFKHSTSSTLKAIGLPPEKLESTLRFSFSPENTMEQIDYFKYISVLSLCAYLGILYHKCLVLHISSYFFLTYLLSIGKSSLQHSTA